MTTVTSEETRGGMFDYAGDPPAPSAVRLRVVQFFDDGTTREIWRDAVLADVFTGWDAATAAQRDALAISAGEKATQIAALTAERNTLAEQLTAAIAANTQLQAQYDQLLNEVEPV